MPDRCGVTSAYVLDGQPRACCREPGHYAHRDAATGDTWITDLEGWQAMVSRLDRLRADAGVAQDDLAAILRELGLGDHARPESPHQVVQDLVLPMIRAWRMALRAAGVPTEEVPDGG